MTNTEILYIQEADARLILEFTFDNLQSLRGRVDSSMKTIEGLMGGALQYDPRSAMIAAELVASLRDSTEDCIARIGVDLIHSENPPAKNAIARALGISTTKLNALDAAASAIPDEE